MDMKVMADNIIADNIHVSAFGDKKTQEWVQLKSNIIFLMRQQQLVN